LSDEKKFKYNLLKFGLVAIVAILIIYSIFRVYSVIAPIISGWWEGLGALEKLTLYVIITIVIGILTAFPLWLLYRWIVLRLRHGSSVRDPRRRILMVFQGTIAKLGLEARRKTGVGLPNELNEIFESRCMMLVFNPDEGGVTRFGERVGNVARVFIGKIPSYVITVKHSKQSVSFAKAQRLAEIPIVRRVVGEIERKHGSFSAIISVLGYGITGLTCGSHFPIPRSQVLLRVVVADRERSG